MGEFVNTSYTLIGITIISFLLILLNLAAVGDAIIEQPWDVRLPLLLVLVVYLLFLSYLAVGPTAWRLLDDNIQGKLGRG